MSRESSVVDHLRQFSLFIVVIVAFAISGINAKPPRRIVGGTDAQLGEVPYQTSLRVNGKHRCGGTLVSTRHVITAAHCVYDIDPPYNDLVAVTGTNSLTDGGERYSVKDVNVHVNFTRSQDGTWRDDIAVITLVEETKVNTYQAPISLPEEDAPIHAVGLVSGWGHNDFDDFPDGEFSTILQKSDMTILSNDECQNAHKFTIDDNEICGFKGNYVGTCSGDDGSSLVYGGAVVGIASWYYPCGLGLPDVYTRVYGYMPWILDIISRTFLEELFDYEDFENFPEK